MTDSDQAVINDGVGTISPWTRNVHYVTTIFFSFCQLNLSVRWLTMQKFIPAIALPQMNVPSNCLIRMNRQTSLMYLRTQACYSRKTLSTSGCEQHQFHFTFTLHVLQLGYVRYDDCPQAGLHVLVPRIQAAGLYKVHKSNGNGDKKMRSGLTD